ncbi:ABC transporter ATP-binding protein [Variovorax sp. J22G73]|uniref:ABC transporter ATP-binding protein n=1 Tax=unclassified Variovorax TaxID=663243 RepID=UPI000D5EAD0E|nr:MULTISPECIES: ABC transporter ATP-binding protein [unclassified Variovorax]MDM0006643.1 ABC transporter ATP-binding protein [Variovorax sp. J22R203]MDM0097333.1 ABC transporter ATP-binding protein [Variovorax sp. J22G73]
MSSIATDAPLGAHTSRAPVGVRSAAPSASIGSRIAIRGLSRRFGRFTAVDNVDLQIEPGEFVTLLGPSGSGKTTLLGAIAGFAAVDEGDILVDGRSVRGVPPHQRGFGMVFQHYALFPHMTVAQNVGFPLRMAGLGRAESTRRIGETLALLHLGEYAERLPAQLSGGQQQRVAIARAIVRRPPVVLMDEPLSALDRRLREAIQIEIRALHRTLGTTIVFVTHDQGEALALSDRIAVLDKGRIVQVGTPGALYRQPGNEFVARFVGESNVLDARVLRVHGEAAVLHIDHGQAFEARHAGTPLSPGQEVKVLVRPERVALVAAGTAGALAATVESTVFLGEILRVDALLPGGGRLQVRGLDPRDGHVPAIGDTVHLAWQAGDAWVLA